MTETVSGKYLKFIQKRPYHLQALRKLQAESERLADDEELFLNTFAPALCVYTEWVLRKASNSGITRLYFLSRDGYMPLAVAERLKELICPDMELKYLNVSRYSLRSGQYYGSGAKCLDTICTGGIDITFEKMMKRAQLTDEECMKIAAAIGMTERTDEVLDYRSILKIKEKLRSVPEFFEIVKEHAKIPYENVRGYLFQEGLGEEKTAIVDAGWIGTIQESLAELTGAGFLKGYYFGLYEVPCEKKPDLPGRMKNYDSFYIKARGTSGDGIQNLKRKKDFSICLFETVCSSPEGMTVGYEKGPDGKYVPVTDMDRNPNAGHIERYHGLIEKYASEYAGELKRDTDLYDEEQDIEMVSGIMSSLMGDPSYEEVSAFGDLLFCDDVLESDLKKVAAVIPIEDVKKSGLLKRIMSKAGMHKDTALVSAWPEGSIVRAAGDSDTPSEKIRKRAIKNEHAMRMLTEIRKAL